MGWWGMTVEKRQPVLAQILQINPEIKRENIVAHCFSRFTFFMAYRGEDGKITAYAVLCRYTKVPNSTTRTQLRTKIIHESEGPYYYGATAKVLDALDETEAPYAVEWRKKNRALLLKEVKCA